MGSTMSTPIELIKIRQQNVLDKQLSTREVMLDIIRKNGIRGIYRGITATALRDCGYGAYFAAVSGIPYSSLLFKVEFLACCLMDSMRQAVDISHVGLPLPGHHLIQILIMLWTILLCLIN